MNTEIREDALFGPGGNSDRFRLEGCKSTVEAPAWVKKNGLDVYEFEAGRGVASSDEALRQIGEEARSAGVYLTFHAPYFISLSGVELEKRLNSLRYIEDSLRASRLLGAHLIVVHAGSASKISREEAMRLAKDTLYKGLESLDIGDITVGLETMGKKNQLGTLDEIIELCRLSPAFAPVVDFGHLNARECGGVFTGVDSYRAVFDKIGNALGDVYARNLHCHFSKIAWTEGGEKKHLTFEDDVFGPDFEPLMEAIARERLTPTIVCESAGTQADDAILMKQAYLRYRK